MTFSFLNEHNIGINMTKKYFIFKFTPSTKGTSLYIHFLQYNNHAQNFDKKKYNSSHITHHRR